MNNLDERLTNGLHGIVDGELNSTPPMGQLLERGRRARRRRSSAAVSGTLAVLAIGAIGTATLVQPSTPAHPNAGIGPSAQGVESPEMELASAITTTENTSYKIRVVTPYPVTSSLPDSTRTVEGAFDPATNTGYLRSEIREERLINGVHYYRHYEGRDKQWVLDDSRKYDRLPYDASALYDSQGDAADPDKLFKVLRQAHAKITKTGERTYHFDGTTRTDKTIENATASFVGDITLDDKRRVAKVTYDWKYQGKTKAGAGFSKTLRATLELSDYGTPVTVERPTNVVVPHPATAAPVASAGLNSGPR